MRFLKNSFAAVLIICTLASCSIAFAATPSSENSLGMSPQAQENFSKAPYKIKYRKKSSLLRNCPQLPHMPIWTSIQLQNPYSMIS